MRRLASLAAAFALAIAGAAQAQEYPTKPITLVVPFPAGGATDQLMRVLGEAASKHLGQPVIVDNRAGGGGAIGPGTMAITAKPDGYTIAQIPIPVYRLPMMQKTSWSHEDFSYIIHLTGYTFMLVAGSQTNFRTWQDVVDFAKANPGKVTYGTSGTGGTPHLGTKMIAEKAGIKLTHVPFKGAAEADVSLLGGPRHDDCRWHRQQTARRRRLGLFPQHLDGKSRQARTRHADAEGAWISLRHRLVIRPRRTERHGSQDRRQAARCLQEGDGRAARGRSDGPPPNGAELQEHCGLHQIHRRTGQVRRRPSQTVGALQDGIMRWLAH
jgi:hypothetical protein